jgi:hypothetical protein
MPFLILRQRNRKRFRPVRDTDESWTQWQSRVLAKPLAGKLVPELSAPRNWVVEGEAQLRVEAAGFGGSAGKWIQQTMDPIEPVREGKP